MLCPAGHAQHDRERGLKRAGELRADVVRIALSNGLTLAQQSSFATTRGAQAGG